MKIPGNVTISLDDYDVLRSEFKSATRMKESLKRTSKELGVFLSFICSRVEMNKVVEEFNMQSVTSKIKFEGDKAIIEFRDDSSKI
tara:strand:+ start:1310 stop:1567 length:258 start_codon:yes stop_codon:yes gene_type:complete